MEKQTKVSEDFVDNIIWGDSDPGPTGMKQSGFLRILRANGETSSPAVS